MPAYSSTGSGNVHIDVALSQISVAYPQGGFVGENLFPSVGVKRISDKYYVFGREAWQADLIDLRAPGAEASEIPGMALSLDSYYAQEHALQIGVNDEERENTDSPMSPDRDATELVSSKVLLGREVAMKNLVTTAANYPAALTTTLSGTTQWSDYVNSDPISDFKVGKRAVHANGLYMEPNTAVIPYQVMSILEDHPDFIERIKYSQRGLVTSEIIASLIGIPKIVVPGVGYDSAHVGQAASLGYLWGKDVVMAWVPDRAGPKIPAFGYEFKQGEQYVDRWREDPRKRDVIRTTRRYDLKLVALDSNSKTIAGYLIKNAVA